MNVRFEQVRKVIRRTIWDDATWNLLGGVEEAITEIPAIKALLRTASTEEEFEDASFLIAQASVECMHNHEAFRRLIALQLESLGVEEKVAQGE